MQVNILELDKWETPASKYQPKQVGNYRLGHHTYYPGLYSYHGIDGYHIFSLKKETRTTTLMELRPNHFGMLGWKEWMIDSPPDYRAMQKYAEAAHGSVLTSGLGLGLLVHELAKNPKVDKIVVVEKSKDVIDLIQPYLPQCNIDIIQSDFWSYIKFVLPNYFQTVIADIWVYYGLEEQLQMYRTEILTAYETLERACPNAQIVCHGFAGHPTEEQILQLVKDGNHLNPLVSDPLIYGLAKDAVFV